MVGFNPNFPTTTNKISANPRNQLCFFSRDVFALRDDIHILGPNINRCTEGTR